ncbi:MAG: RidA family protein [Anaerolineae bacterium]|nr:RidA family protein [Anaerolineae bacterium]
MRQVIASPEAPQAVGPYSQAIKVGQFVFTSGQLGLDPATGAFAGEDIVSQTRQALHNLDIVLQAAGSDLAHVVKTTIFVIDLGDFKTVNQIYGEYFESAPPARSTVQVAALPLGGLVEIEMVAVVE